MERHGFFLEIEGEILLQDDMPTGKQCRNIRHAQPVFPAMTADRRRNSFPSAETLAGVPELRSFANGTFRRSRYPLQDTCDRTIRIPPTHTGLPETICSGITII
ncbi:MAG TPA: hypothetical protein VI140_05845 [Oxalicibacterium sp.]